VLISTILIVLALASAAFVLLVFLLPRWMDALVDWFENL
jgi:hypothetical protein